MDDDEGGPWAIKTAEQIVARCYPNMGVTYSSDGEYTSSEDILLPQTFTTNPEPDMAWRPAKSLLTLRDQVDAKWPDRDKSSDGIIGDARHQAGKSDHNPDAEGIVRAMDISNDPAHGLVSRKLAEDLLATRDPRIRYLISDAEIVFSPEAAEANSATAWVWKAYHGENPHRAHMHLSISHVDALADDTKPWKLDGAAVEPLPADDLKSGKGSWYSQYSGKYEWIDKGDKPGSNALRVPDSAQGISFFNHDTLGNWFMVYAPNGANSVEQQTDIGPHPSTGRLIDISAAAAERFGYSPKNFPTDSIFKWRPIPAPVSGTPQEQAIKFRDVRSQPMPPPDPAIDNDLIRIAAAVANLRSLAQSQDSRITALEHNTMPSPQPQPQIDWGAILRPIIEALLPQLPKLLPQLLPALAPIIAALLTQWLRPPAAQPVASNQAPWGSIITTVLGGLATAVLGGMTAGGILPPTEGMVATGAGLAVTAGGGTQLANSVNKPKAQP